MIFMHPSVLRFKKHQSTFRFSLLLAVCFGLNQAASFAQLYNYTNDSTGLPATVALNMTGDSLTRGAGVADLSLGCFGPTKGFGSHGWPTTNTFNANTFNNITHDYITFTVRPDAGFGLKITGFSAQSRRENQPGNASDGPIALRYGFSLDTGVTWTIVNPGNPTSSNQCTNNGVLRVWPSFPTINTGGAVIFRIYGLSSGSLGTGDLFLKNVVVEGEVCANAPTIALGTSPSECFSSLPTSTTLPYTTSTGTEYIIDYDAAAILAGFVDPLAYAALPTMPNAIPITIPGGVAPGTYNGTITVRNGCGFSDLTPEPFTVTVKPLPTVAIAIAETSGTTNNDGITCSGALVTLTASGGSSYLWSAGAATSAAISVNPAITTTYTVTVTGANGCTKSVSQVITVNAITATANAGADQTTCFGGIVQLAGLIGGTATDSTWTASIPGGIFYNNGTVVFYTPPPGNNPVITLVLTTDGLCPARDTVVVNYGILPALELTIDAPENATCGDTIVVNVVATNGFDGMSSLQYTVDWDETKLAYMSHTVTTIGTDIPGSILFPAMQPYNHLRYAWVDAGSTGESLADNTVLITFTMKVVSSVGGAEFLVTGSHTPIEATNYQFCTLDVDVLNDTIELSPIAVSCPNDSTVCLNDPLVDLTGGMPDGGEYSGTGVSDGSFDPEIAGAGIHTITYTYTDGNDCSNTCTFSITVNPLPDVSIGIEPAAICIGGQVTLTFTDNVPTGHLFSIVADLVDDAGPHVGAINFTGISSGASDTYVEGVDFNGAVTGSVLLTNISITDETTGCTNDTEADITVVVNPSPTFSFTASTTSDAGGAVSNSAGPATISVDFCAGDSLILDNYSDLPANIGAIVSYTSTGNVTYDGSPIAASYGPDSITIVPLNALGFFENIYGGAAGYGLSSGTVGTITQVFTPYVDADNNNAYDAGVDCLGDAITLVYNVYAPISLSIARVSGQEICSGDTIHYVFSTTSTEDISFDIVLDSFPNGNNPAYLLDDNSLPLTVSITGVNDTTPYHFKQVVYNAAGKFDRGRVQVSAVNIDYVDADVCATADVVSLNPTRVYPEPRLIDPADVVICSGSSPSLNLALMGLLSDNSPTAGYPVRVEWTVSAPGITGAVNDTINIYNGAGNELQLINDLLPLQVLTLDTLANGPKTATYTFTPRASGPTNGFNADDCFGEPITVVVTVVPPAIPSIAGAPTVHAGSVIQLFGEDNVALPASVVSAVWSSSNVLIATVDTIAPIFDTAYVTGISPGGPDTIFYTVTDDAGCVSTAEHIINVLDTLLLESFIDGLSEVACGADIDVQVRVSNFQDINSMDFSVNWDPTKFEYFNASAPNIDGSPAYLNTTEATLGHLGYTWGDDQPPFSANLANGSVVLTYTLRAIGSADTSNVVIADMPNLQDAYNGSSSQVAITSTGVSIEIIPISLELGNDPVVCPGDQFATLTFSDVIGIPDTFYIVFNSGCPGFPGSFGGDLDIQDSAIVISLPPVLLSGVCDATLVVGNTENGCVSAEYDFSIIIDTLPPTASSPAPILQACSPAPLPNPALVINEADNCPGPITVAYIGDVSDGGSGCGLVPNIITRTYRVTDAAGNTTDVTQTITIRDNIAPTVSTVGMAIWYSNEADAIAAALAIADTSKHDNCTPPAGITVTPDSIIYDACAISIHLILADACGNLSTAIYTTTIDTENPTADVMPIDDCYEASEDINNQYFPYQYAAEAALAATVGNDDCTDPEDLVYTVAFTSTNHCNLEIAVTVTDRCGKDSIFYFDTRVDSESPIIDVAADTLSIEHGFCFQTVEAADSMARVVTARHTGDDCGVPDELQYEVEISEGCPAEITVFVTDYCGNVSSITYTNVHIDTEAPTVSPDEGYPTCFQHIDSAFVQLAAASNAHDNCTSDEDLLESSRAIFIQTSGNDSCTSGTVRIYFTDLCGLTDSIDFEEIIIDDIDPVLLSFPVVDTSYACISEVAAPDEDGVSVSDNCNGDVTVTWISDILPTVCPGILRRTYRLTDGCGNTVDAVQMIMINDNIAPTWITGSNDLNHFYACDNEAYVDAFEEYPVAEDNCGEIILEKTTGLFVPSMTCPQEGTYTNTWTARDSCGNISDVFTQVITIIDNQAPFVDFGAQFMLLTLTTDDGADCPADADISLQVGESVNPTENWFVAGIAIDNLEGFVSDSCSSLEEIKVTLVGVEYAEHDTFPTGCSKLIIASFLISDACGNINPDTFVCHYLIIDNTAPVWMTQDSLFFPAGIDANVSCSDVAAYNFANSRVPVATDNCPGTVTVVKTQGVFTPGLDCPSEGTVTNTFVAYDACGGHNPSTVFTQVISIYDNLPPTFDPQCQSDLDLFTSEGADCPQSAEISLTVGQVLDNNDTWFVGGVEIDSFGTCVQDNCSAASLIKIHVVSIVDEYDTENCSRDITVNFQLEDACGNIQQAPFVSVYHLFDDTAPELFCALPPSDTLPQNCYASAAAAEADALAYFDSIEYRCDNCTPREDLLLTAVATGTCDASVKVTLTDCAGNIDTFTFHTHIDNIAPTVTAGQLSANCFATPGLAGASAIAATTISDNCNSIGGLSVSFSIDGTCPASITVTAVDSCGNANSVVYDDICIGAGSSVVITTDASDQTVDCSNKAAGLSAWLTNHGGAIANSADTTWTYTTPVFALNCSTHKDSAIVKFKVTDGCGYMDSTTAVFYVQDLTAPMVSALPTLNLVGCSSSIAPLAPPFTSDTLDEPSILAYPPTGLNPTDNCDNALTVRLLASSSMGTGCPGSPFVILRNYSVTDDYCNTTYVTQTINIVDNVPPMFTAPANTTINVDATCHYDTSPAVTGDVTNESDNCSAGLEAMYTDVITPGGGFQVKEVITRTWTLKDNCMNSAPALTQIITVKDVTAPTIVCPASVALAGQLSDLVCVATLPDSFDPVSVGDNCEGAVPTYSMSGFFLGSSSGMGYVSGRVFKEGVTTVTYTITDAVGNSTSCSFTVSVNCITVSGKIKWIDTPAMGVQNATVRLTPSMPTISDLSDFDGNYELNIPASGTFTVTPIKNINRMNGVTAADATRIQQHLSGVLLATPYKKVAADVNRNGFITTQDANLITQCIANNQQALGVFNVFWRFTPTSFPMPVTAANTVPAFPENIVLMVTGSDVVNQDFYGMKIGDVTGDALPWLTPNGNPLVWILKDQVLQAGKEIELDFTATNFEDFAALQFALDFDPSYLQFTGFQSLGAIPMTADNFGTTDAALGELRVVWSQATGLTLADGTPVLKAKFKVLQGGQKLSEVLQLDNSTMLCEAYTAAFVTSDVRVAFVESVSALDPLDFGKPQLRLFQNQPNPFAGETTIGFVLPGACDAQLRIMDVSGRELTNYKRTYTAGYHEIEFRMENAASYGVLYYELITPFGKLTKKMVTTGK
jgi:hypothetical protein